MKAIFLVTVSGLRRTPEKTRTFLNEAGQVLQIRYVGVDLRKIARKTLFNSYDLSLAELVCGGYLSPGEIGCLLSHQKIYTIIANENIDWALVVEDDAEILVNSQTLLSISQDWFDSGYELVHLAPYAGGVVLNERKDKSGLALVPPLTTYAYWISNNGARKLQTKDSIIGGLADWPIQVANLRMRAVFTPLAFSGVENSTIEILQDFSARNRISLSYLPS